MGWTNFELLVQQFQDRLIFGIQKELMELVKVPHVKGKYDINIILKKKKKKKKKKKD